VDYSILLNRRRRRHRRQLQRLRQQSTLPRKARAKARIAGSTVVVVQQRF
jgi:hypothetical protein